MNKVFYFINNKGTRKDKKLSIRKLISPLNVQASERKYEKPFKSLSWSDSEALAGDELKFQP